MGGEYLKDAEALQWMKKAAAQGYDEAYLFLYLQAYSPSQAIPSRDEEDNFQTSHYLNLCCGQQSPGGRFGLGNRGIDGVPISPSKDDAKIRWYVKEAEQGNVVAQYKLGIIYGGWVFGDNIHSNKYYGDTGNGINRSEGRRLLRIAAEQGNVFASYELRNLAEVDFITTSFDNIEDETQASAAVAHWDELAAGQWYGIEKKAERGDAEEQYNLGEMHFHGKGTEPNSIKAFRWYELAANQGFAPAQNMIGLMYTKNEDIVQNYAEAVRWYKLAADQGYANAQHNLGVMYQKGSGVTQSYAEAEKWYKLAAAQGYAPAQDVLKELGW
jgi:TPR repeat protein